MRILWLCFILFACSSEQPKSEGTPAGLAIEEVQPSQQTALVKQHLIHLAQIYDLAPLLYTKKIRIDSKVISHSYPVLTLNTRFAEAPEKLLSIWLHEELHWWGMMKVKEFKKAMDELRKEYKVLPSEGVARSPASTYLHFLICSLELKALGHFLGRPKATAIITEIMAYDKIYPWIYGEILKRPAYFEELLKRFDLIPPALQQ